PVAGQALDPTEVIAFAKARLGGVKAPKQVEVWPDLPRSKVGKVLKADIRASLLETATDQVGGGRTTNPPRPPPAAPRGATRPSGPTPPPRPWRRLPTGGEEDGRPPPRVPPPPLPSPRTH